MFFLSCRRRTGDAKGFLLESHVGWPVAPGQWCRAWCRPCLAKVNDTEPTKSSEGVEHSS